MPDSISPAFARPLEGARASYAQACETLQATAAEIEAYAASPADEQTPEKLAELEAQFSEAEQSCGAFKTEVERWERLSKTQIAHATPPQAPATGGAPGVKVQVTSEPATYTERSGVSFFRDMYNATMKQDRSAIDRLDRHKQETADKYAQSSTDSAGGYLVPPVWLQSAFADVARAARVTVDLIGPQGLPPNTDSINIPLMTGGVAVSDQATENTAVANQDATFGAITADVKTLAGYVDVSQQVLDRSIPGIDGVIYQDLVKVYNTGLNTRVLTSATANNLGILAATGTNSVTYTSASPTVAGLYPKVADAIQQIATGIFMPAGAIIMHPRRWAWILAAEDGMQRPLVTPYAPENLIASFGGVIPQGLVGNMQGLPVYTDALIPVNLGAGTNEDRIIVLRADESFVWEESSGPFLETFRDVGSKNLTIELRLHNYWAQTHVRRPKGISIISGTGLAAPTF